MRWIRSFLGCLVRVLQVDDALTVGGFIVLPVGIALALIFFIDSFLAKLWGGAFDRSGTEQYFFVPGTALALTIFLVYLGGRIGKSHWFMASFGRLVVRSWVVGGWYKQAIRLMYARKGFLQPVWVYKTGLLEFDDAGNVIRALRGARRRAYFLREVYDDNPELPPALSLTCELLIPPSQVFGGEPEKFPFQLVDTQLDPGFGQFTQAIWTQGLAGYVRQSTLGWAKARTRITLPVLPEKDRKLLDGLGIKIDQEIGCIQTE